MGWSSIGPIQPQGEYTLPVANIANQRIGLAIDQYPSCNGNQCQTWSKEGPSPTYPYQRTGNEVPEHWPSKPRPRNPKKKTQKEKAAIALWKRNR